LPNEVAAQGWGHRWLRVCQPVAPIALPAAAPEPTPGPTAIALVNGTLIDGTGADPVPDAVVVVQDGRIAAVGPRAQVAIPTDARVVDVQGGTILPGFINAHVHSAYDGYNLAAWARAGVTTVRELNAPGTTINALQPIYAFRDATLTHPRYARIVGASPIMTVPDGYGIVFVTSPEDARQKATAFLDAGADVIKISFEDALQGGGWSVLSVEEAKAIVAVAHERGVPVTVHVSRANQLEWALDAGVDDIAHMPIDKIPDPLIARTVAADVYIVPTLELWQGVYMDWEASNNLRRFVAAGGKVALGTDYAGPNIRMDLGMPIHEVLYMQKAGMTPMQIIVAATRNAAHVCNRDRTLGTLEVGKAADILVVDGDPLVDLLALTKPRLVLRDGVVIAP
jgi:imidazolonepropionase-like amidohydrolase